MSKLLYEELDGKIKIYRASREFPLISGPGPSIDEQNLLALSEDIGVNLREKEFVSMVTSLEGGSLRHDTIRPRDGRIAGFKGSDTRPLEVASRALGTGYHAEEIIVAYHGSEEETLREGIILGIQTGRIR